MSTIYANTIKDSHLTESSSIVATPDLRYLAYTHKRLTPTLALTACTLALSPSSRLAREIDSAIHTPLICFSVSPT